MVDQVGDENLRPEPILPPVPKPGGAAFFLGTWSGRFILINTIIFLMVSWESGSLMLPSEEVLTKWGAKDNVLIVQGEFWRFFTPMFVHIGIIHFAFNNLAIYILGYQIEFLIKSKWYVILYLLAGIGGNIASAVFSMGLSAGASSSLFGILGAGFFLERTVGSKLNALGGSRPRAKIYTGLLAVNLVLGLIIPMIDNAAHMGGLAVGLMFTFALLNLRPNRLLPLNPLRGRLALGVLTCLFLLGLGLSCSEQYVRQRFESAVLEADRPALKHHYLTHLLRLDPDDVDVRLRRLMLLLTYNDRLAAAQDFARLNELGVGRQEYVDMIAELEGSDAKEGAEWLRQKIDEGP